MQFEFVANAALIRRSENFKGGTFHGFRIKSRVDEKREVWTDGALAGARAGAANPDVPLANIKAIYSALKD